MTYRKFTHHVFALAAIAALTPITISSTAKSWATLQTGPKATVDEVWQLLDRNYVDGTFNHQDWRAVRQTYLSRNYTSKEQAYAAIREMVGKLGDRYTEFYDPQEYKALNMDIEGKLSGVGLELAADEKTKALTVVAPIEDSPAAKAGILAGDVITRIDQQPTQGLNINDAVKRIKGTAGTPVVLTVQRGGQELTYKLTRADIMIHPVTYSLQNTAIGAIGYIRLPEFTQTAPAEMRRAIQALEKQQVKGYVLDLRSDPGGLLTSGLEIANQWLKQGSIVSLVNREQEKERYTANGSALTDKPLVVLVDGGSASASEILAGALQDDGRAVLVGSRTFGKGLVQAIQPLDDGSALKLTIAKYYTPQGKDINHVGITPNVTIELTEAQQQALLRNRALGTAADPQYASAIAQLRQLIHAKTVSSTLPNR